MSRHLGLGALVHGSGGHIAGWRHPDARPDGQLDLGFHVELAQTLERGGFDALFVADVVAIWGEHLDSLHRTGRAEHFEPLTLLSALSQVTERIGLVATATTTYHEPFHLARKFASLDHLSAGRAGWNIVTSVVPLEAANFGRDSHLEHGARYARAAEFVDVVESLWASLDPLRDKESGRYYEPAGLRLTEHEGEHFRVRGPLNVSRPPQGRPVLFQAGSSETGKDFAARYGEVVFTGQPDAAAGKAFVDDLHARVRRHGRDPDRVRVWPLVSPLVAPTETEARAKARALLDLLHDDVARRLVQDNIGDVDLTGYDVHGPLPDIPDTNRSKSRRDGMLALARRENLTIRGLAERFSGGTLAGTPEQIADHLEEWFHAGAADGFMVSFPYLPGPAVDFVEQVVPELRRRGLVRDGYAGTTLRDHLGLT
ncbi:Nitrilotriacetate monooxygenase component A [Pseudonocardia sp. Ae406_Ps2]|uniref:LLM class flavin-dependent oxidoreductase n=1 Tax=unclassified Pseudonocardia TaxID=2619320 RepID=UPI00094AFB77|nr:MULTISPECIES: LLM class flavin-dependent oxidoreductase [unclassified Pseudonocardia]OLM01290.1 Nitrilotriacetate monooxygenase component A [Pseudonocardia sp. Ae406_Ps2]OLM06913.1 Nitrilotriacetate monooxygenase component A [Pseudonocardia sp. Ae331_Ps2]OLM14089.1 Nitrilotriacetate monooxygenase component A [Pseudonocardia sp. Ae505_Ps2]OLM22863.1 Nitrilotriacetate monooxygenase component A [Pseudonocardia sp. Ae706_Ps2]OLM31267.1 Nitrilotriacetate monooxygenase component A [Pseudonocardia